MNKVRVDKWLWTVRIFKSRTQATDACKKGKIKIGEEILKPSFLVEANTTLLVRKDKFNLIFKVLKIIPNRVSATLAAECYVNLTPEEELNKFKEFDGSAFYIPTNYVIDHRPTKKERRELDDFME